MSFLIVWNCENVNSYLLLCQNYLHDSISTNSEQINYLSYIANSDTVKT